MMTKDQATSFDSVSMNNAITVASQLTCDCQPYLDVFTYNRWIAQGYRVMKGQHGIHITTFVPIKKTEQDGNVKVIGRVPKTSVVFCRCQVEKVDN